MGVVTSLPARCDETADLFGLVPESREERIAEMHREGWVRRSLSGVRTDLGESMTENEAHGMEFRPLGGEGPRAVLACVSGRRADVAAESRLTLAITHRGEIRVVLAAASRWDMCRRPPVKPQRSAVRIFRLTPSGLPAVMRLNVSLVERADVSMGSVAQ